MHTVRVKFTGRRRHLSPDFTRRRGSEVGSRFFPCRARAEIKVLSMSVRAEKRGRGRQRERWLFDEWRGEKARIIDESARARG